MAPFDERDDLAVEYERRLARQIGQLGPCCGEVVAVPRDKLHAIADITARPDAVIFDLESPALIVAGQLPRSRQHRRVSRQPDHRCVAAIRGSL